MDDSGLAPRRTRPESSPSRGASSHGSTVHRPRPSAGARAGPGVSLLQERLRERKVETARERRARTDVGAGERAVQSSPAKVTAAREERRPSSSGVTRGQGMGVKQIEEQVSTLHKQNFDLKLELYHRRQRQEALEARLEAAEKEIAEQQEVNEQLLAELEKRDQAVEEAVGIIVNLEDKVERLTNDREAFNALGMQKERGSFRESYEPSSSPPRFDEIPPHMRPDVRAVPRMPSFLSEQSEGTEALRSLYLPHDRTQSDATLPKLPEEPALDVPDSPRLSILSKSSLLSIYGDKELSPAPSQVEEIRSPERTHRKSSSVERWVDERPARTATPKRSPVRDGIRSSGFLSINDVLESPLQRLEKLKHTLEKHNTSLVSTRPPERSRSLREGGGLGLRAGRRRNPTGVVPHDFTDRDSFEHYQTLPPTPDTFSTSTLTQHQNSNDALGQQLGVKGKLLNKTPAFPVPNFTYNPNKSVLSLRPRSAGETVTSRREGHGWDTETAEDLTETASLSSTASASAYPAPTRQKMIMPPDLFNFSDLNNRDEVNDWGSDMMFSNSAPRLPTHTARRYDQFRRSSMVDNPPCDGTVPNDRVVQHNRDQHSSSSSPFGASLIDSSPRPSLPDRRSSLSATTKLRKTNHKHSLVDTAQASANSPMTKDTTAEPKSARLAVHRIFTRSETAPSGNSFQHLPFPRSDTGNGLSYFDDSHGTGFEDDDGARATPPPIKRSRGPNIPAYRPSSSGEGAVRATRGNGFGFDGPANYDANAKRRSVELSTAPRNEIENASPGVKHGSGRNWLGFARTGSLRRG